MATPFAKVSMLVRCPPAKVFEAFVNPEFLTKFWLSRASGPLEPGKTVTWDFMVPGASAKTHVEEMLPHRLIRLSWDDGTTVSFAFESYSDVGTRIEVVNAGFSGDSEEAMKAALEATQGFTIVLCDLKATLEHGRSMGCVRDKALLIDAKQSPDRSR
jgi:uncharacterized protein YndB with AHSA1/START domain